MMGLVSSVVSPFVKATRESVEFSVEAILNALSVTTSEFTLAELVVIKRMFPSFIPDMDEDDLKFMCMWLEQGHNGFWLSVGSPKHAMGWARRVHEVRTRKVSLYDPS